MLNIRTRSLRKHLGLASAFGAALVLLILFQNFQPVPLNALKPEFSYAHARIVNTTDGSADMRQIAPFRPETRGIEIIAVPQSGTDLNSVSQDWLTRQSKILTGGAEEKLLASVNKRMNRLMKWETVEGEPWPESADDEDAKPSGGGDSRAPAGTSAPEEDTNAYFGLKPTSLNLVAVNRLQLGLANRTRLSCSFEGSSVRWDLSRPITHRMDVNLRHESSGAKSTFHLNYSW